ncbi:hypothetical protein AQUCO_01500324v1 [Aquilegia coerulea]|uniref:RNA helicase n=1 Tax=Aquilegia coerulea TaxID=218851 RepID=A0A2G5DT76_AQUCA|nr:hypothetical protein AQUCO_01500324v1 [Aquilegia coerulea]
MLRSILIKARQQGVCLHQLTHQRSLHTRNKKAMELIAKGWNALQEVDRVIDYTEPTDPRLHPLFRTAKENFELALEVDNSNTHARYWLGRLHMKYQCPGACKAIGAALLVEAADMGDPDAQYELGCRLRVENEDVQSDQQAFYYIEKAVDQLHPGALYLLGAVYLTGDCVKQDVGSALWCFHRASQKGHTGAAIAYGSLLLQGAKIPEALTIFNSIRSASTKAKKNAGNFEDPVDMAKEQFEIAANAGCDLGLRCYLTNKMAMWGDSVSDSSHYGGGSSRPTRPSYVPPHQRNSNKNNNNRGGGGGGGGFSAPHNLFHSSSPQRYGNNGGNFITRPTRGGRGRGGGGVRGWFQRNPIPITPNNNYFDANVTNKFANLGVVDKEKIDSSTGTGGINFDAYDDIPVETSGNDVPSPVTTFAEIDLGEALNQNIKRCKYVKPTPVQRHAIPIAIAGRDLMACAQTGSGKTAAFCFPIISGIINKHLSQPKQPSMVSRSAAAASPLALILSPTRELSCQIFEEVKKFSYQTGVRVVVAYGGAPMHEQLRELDKGVDILVATPGRLVDMIERARVSLRLINYLALDEADRMLDMGFEPQIRKIVERMDMPRPGTKQTLLFSATFPDEIQRLASDFLSNYIFLTVGRVGSSTDLIEQRVDFVEDVNKRSHLMDLLRTQRKNGKQALTVVFVETKRGADSLEHWLSVNGFPATAIHGDKVQYEREKALRLFKSGVTPIMVATDVAARGLDIPHVAHVINFDMPKDIDDYVHRIGRTGRAGKSGLATAFFNEGNQSMAKALADLMKEANQEVPPWLSEYAQRPSYGGGGRGRRYGGGRFGAYDYRKDSPSAGDYYSSSYGADSGTVPYVPVAAPISNGYGYENGSVPASGWD